MPIADTGQSLFLIQEPIDATTLNDQDRQFISQASAANQAEIDAGELATSRSDNTAVQTFGQWMIADHSALAAALRGVTRQLGVETDVTLTPEQRAEIQNLESTSGAAFDQLYGQDQVADHQQALALFQQQAATGQNATLVNLAQQAIPILEQHLAGAQQLAGTPSTGTISPAPPPASAGAAVGTPSEQDVNFVQFAAQSGLAELQEGQLAISNTSDPAVSEFGRWMVTDHTAVNANLLAVAQQEGISVPTEPTAAQQDEIVQLQSLSPSDFATTYTNHQINDHVNTLMQFMQEASTGQDPAIKDFAQNTIPLLTEHLVGAGNLKLDQLGFGSVSSQFLPDLRRFASESAAPGAVGQLNQLESVRAQAVDFLQSL